MFFKMIAQLNVSLTQSKVACCPSQTDGKAEEISNPSRGLYSSSLGLCSSRFGLYNSSHECKFCRHID